MKQEKIVILKHFLFSDQEADFKSFVIERMQNLESEINQLKNENEAFKITCGLPGPPGIGIKGDRGPSGLNGRPFDILSDFSISKPK